MENVLEIIIPVVLCLGGLCYFWYSSKKGNAEEIEDAEKNARLRSNSTCG